MELVLWKIVRWSSRFQSGLCCATGFNVLIISNLSDPQLRLCMESLVFCRLEGLLIVFLVYIM